MHDKSVEIPTRDGRMETFIIHPEQDGPFPAVVVYMDFWGMREELFDIARRIATVGYYCLVPDLYYRQGKVRTEFEGLGEVVTREGDRIAYEGEVPQTHIEYSADYEVLQLTMPADFPTTPLPGRCGCAHRSTRCGKGPGSRSPPGNR
jgi:hypothetical protein